MVGAMGGKIPSSPEADLDFPVEPDLTEGSSADTGDCASTFSLTSSVIDYPIENGRRYHRFHEGSYVLPNDEVEMERERLHYELLRLVMGNRDYFAPLSNPQHILDIGTGTGQWVMEMAELFPNCRITGTDLSPIQPQSVPPNVHFLVDDAAEEDWLYPLNSFDYIHTRMMCGTLEDFREVIKKSFKYLKPGGWMECQDYMMKLYCDDGTMAPDYPYSEWLRTIDDAAMRLGKPLRIANKFKKWMEAAGFVDVHEEIFKVPINPWPRDPHLKDVEIGRAHV